MKIGNMIATLFHLVRGSRKGNCSVIRAFQIPQEIYLVFPLSLSVALFILWRNEGVSTSKFIILCFSFFCEYPQDRPPPKEAHLTFSSIGKTKEVYSILEKLLVYQKFPFELPNCQLGLFETLTQGINFIFREGSGGGEL